jgi:uncharacterized protein YndB with AHSA1/START domain
MSDAAVQAKTGRTWPEWFKLLDAEGARQMSHKEIVAVLRDRHGVGPWWQQMVTVTYEQARGLRAKHEVAGGFQVSASRTVAAPVAAVFAAWKDARGRKRWLPGSFTIRSETPDKSLRFAWPDGGRVEVSFYPKGEAKTQVTVQHSRLPDAAAADERKAFWGQVLEALKARLEGQQ